VPLNNQSIKSIYISYDLICDDLLNCAISTDHDPLGLWYQLFHVLFTEIMRFLIFELHGNMAR